ETHAVGMERQLLALVEDQVALFVEVDLARSGQPQLPARADAFQRRWNAVGIDQVGQVALKPRQDGLVGTMAEPGERERTVRFDPDAGDPFQRARLHQPAFAESRGCPHWPDRMRRGRSDADLEQVEYADSHGAHREWRG